MVSDAQSSAAPVHRFILLTDIAQSSRLAEEHLHKYLSALEQHNRLVEQTVAELGGTVYKQTGDGYLVLFETADDCLAAALELGEYLGQLEPLADNEPLLVRLALHAGELHPSGPEYFGPALNRVSRICQVCNPGQVLMSAAVASMLDQTPAAMSLIDLGRHHLRDLSEPEQLFQVDSVQFSRREFPPLSSLDNRRNNLVSQPNSFIGRGRELRELAQQLLGGQRLLSITASGGYGKSRLAAQLGANLLHRFEQGVFMVYLAPVRESLDVPTAIANALGCQFSGSSDPQDQLCDYLREKELLLCLDNFEHVTDCAPLVRKLLDAAPKLKIVITSREPLRLKGERIFVLEPLAVEAKGTEYTEAEQLFGERAQLVKNDFTLQADNRVLVREICSKLSGIPLAIELAAAWMDTFTLTELNNELSNQLELESRESDAEPRHQSLKASLDWSWQLLGLQQQANLMKLSTFRGGFFSEAAGELLGLKGMAIRAALGRLVDKSWVYGRDVNGRTRFFLRDMLTLEYAFGKLQESELYEQAVVAHAAYFSALIVDEGPRLEGDGTPAGQSEALATLRLEQQNIDEALDSLLNRSLPESASEGNAARLLPIAVYLWKLLDRTAAYRELLERYRALVSVAEHSDNLQQVLLNALLGLGCGQWRLGDYDAAHNNLNRAIQLAKLIGDRYGTAWAIHNLATVKTSQGDYDAARELHAESTDIRREIGDRYGIAASLANMGAVEVRQGNYDAARKLYAESLPIRREIGDQYGIASTLNNLGVVEYTQGYSDVAREFYAESLAIRRKIGDRDGTAASLVNLGLVEFNQGNNDAARELQAESLATMRDIGDRHGIASSLSNLGLVESRLGNYDAARELHAESLNIRREIGDRLGITFSLDNLGNMELSQGNYEASLKFNAESLAITREIGDREGEAYSRHGLAVAHCALGKYAEAGEQLSQALAIRRELGNHGGTCMSLCACAALLATCQSLTQAAMCLYGTLHCAAQTNTQFDIIEQELLEQASEMIEHPETGLAAEERERLKSQAEAMNLDELTELALAALDQLRAVLRDAGGQNAVTGYSEDAS